MTTSKNGGEYGQDDAMKDEGHTPSPEDPKCLRCGGLMVIVRCQDLMDNTGAINFLARRCVLCGDLIDPVIQQHRRSLSLAPPLKNIRLNNLSRKTMPVFRKTEGNFMM